MSLLTTLQPIKIGPGILMILTVAFIAIFFLRYFYKQKPKKGTLEWIRMRDKPRFSLERKASMDKMDWILMGGITLAYAVAAFVNLGDFTAPQNFHHFDSREESIVIELKTPASIDTVFYYTGLYHGYTANQATEEHRAYKLEFSTDGEHWIDQNRVDLKDIDGVETEVVKHAMSQKHGETFRWLYAALRHDNPADIRYVRLSAYAVPLELGELSLRTRSADGQERVLGPAELIVSPGGEALFDEQDIVPEDYDILNSSHFDEIYHAYTAYQFTKGVYPYEITHPPLGKEITAVGILIFGMTPFGWRFMPTLFGVFMLPLLYILLVWMFGKRTVSLCGTLLFTFEFMHFAQTRISTIDVYGVFFILLTYMLMYRFITSGYDTPFRKALLPLLGCGITFGLGASGKWIVIYGGFGLAALYGIYLYRRMRYAKRHEEHFAGYLVMTLSVSVLGFIVLGGGLYVLTYIPYALSARPAGEGSYQFWELLSATWTKFWENQDYMFRYHAQSVLGSTHDFSARWYEWLFDSKPILFYRHSVGDSRASLWSFTNPMNTWGGLLALCACVYGLVKKRRGTALFILIGYFSQLLPWISIQRLTFPYHYFPSILFCCIALAYVFDELLERDLKNRRYVYAFTGVTAGLFVLFYPVLSGLPMPSWYGQFFLQWLPKWSM